MGRKPKQQKPHNGMHAHSKQVEAKAAENLTSAPRSRAVSRHNVSGQGEHAANALNKEGISRHEEHLLRPKEAEGRPKAKIHAHPKKAASAKKAGAGEKKHGHDAGIPLHEQIKRKLSEKKKSAHAKLDGHGAHVKADEPEKQKMEEHEKGVKRGVDFERSGKEKAPDLSLFEIKIMRRLDISEGKGRTLFKISGRLGADREFEMKDEEVPAFLESLLPRKINSMANGDEFEVSGMDMDELNKLFSRDILVEPKGELEVAEKEEDGRITITIKVSEPEKPLFNYSAPGVEDVRRLVEREKLRMLAIEKQGKEQAPAGQAQEEAQGSDWLRDQLNAQSKDIAMLAKEMGDLVGTPKKDVIQVGPRPQAKAELGKAPQANLVSSQAIAPGQAPAAGAGGTVDMSEFMDAYKEEASAYVEALKKMPKLKDNPNNAELISEIHRSAHSLKSMSAAMGFWNISKVSKALEMLFAAYMNAGSIEEDKFDAAQEAVDKISALYADLANSDNVDVEEVVKKVESAIPES